MDWPVDIPELLQCCRESQHRKDELLRADFPEAYAETLQVIEAFDMLAELGLDPDTASPFVHAMLDACEFGITQQQFEDCAAGRAVLVLRWSDAPRYLDA